jgi:hypothetical protein
MTKFLNFFVLLLLAFIVANFLYLFILPRIDWDFSKTKEAHSFKNQKLKVLVFGNSTAMDGVNTEMLSDKLGPAYNFSLGGASLKTNYIQLKNYLQQNEVPEKVLLFLSSAHTNYVSANDVNPIVNYYYGNTFHIKKLDDIPLFKFRWLFVENVKKLLSSKHRSAEVIKGQLNIKSIVPDQSFYKKNIDTCLGYNYSGSTGYEYLWKMAMLCKEKNIAVEIFEMPCWKEAQNNCADTTIENTVGNSTYHLLIRNFNNYRICNTLLDPQRDWLSKNHLNHYGSIKLTAALQQKLLNSPLGQK